MAGLLYPAYQKYYSAISSLKRFGIEKNFFDNISNLDNFFSEYRSVTLVMQKSLAHTPYLETYNRLSAGIWDKFFNDQRVKTIHSHPVELVKRIDITVYSPSIGITVDSRSFTVEDDVPLVDLLDSLKDFLRAINPVEMFFSARFSFVEKDTGVDLWDKLFEGLATMEKFMDAMYSEIGESCPLCEKLRDEINHYGITENIRDMLLITDYAYYPVREEFERADRIAGYFKTDGKGADCRASVDHLMSLPYLKGGKTLFDKFVLINVVLGNVDLMPTIMTVYQDKTYELECFHANLKTTLYRKINETAEKILHDDIEEVFVMFAYVAVNYEKGYLHMTSKERREKATSECLAFMKVDSELNEEEYVFDGELIGCPQYIIQQMKYGKQKKLDIGMMNMQPIIEAFKMRGGNATVSEMKE